jgi:NADPH2:quinone reductase
MRAVQVKSFGGPEVLHVEELSDPVPGAGELLVRFEAVDTLNIETWIRAGLASEWFATRPPYIPGGGGAGTVISVGSDVHESWVGRRVLAGTPQQEGAYAELAIAKVESSLPLPDSVAAADAAAVLHDGATAFGLLAGTPVNAGDVVLVLAAGGGLGLLLTQLARSAGAEVIAAARGAAKLAAAREAGASAVVDYTEPGWVEVVREATGGKGANVVFDGAGGELGLAAFDVTAPGGRMSLHGAASGSFAPVNPETAAERGITVRGIEQVRLGDDVAAFMALVGQAVDAVAAGTLRPVIGRTYPLEQADQAHQAIENRAVVGKTLLLP